MKKNNCVKVVIPVEIKTRELFAKVFLAMVLACRGYDVYIGNKIQHTALGRINPDIYFETSACQQASRLQRCKKNGVKTLILETEGAAWSGVEACSEMADNKTLNHTDCYCAWGEVAKQIIKNEEPTTRVEITGNPRFDLVQEPHRKIYYQTASTLNREYGNYILFNGNFSYIIGKNTIKEKSEHYNEESQVWRRVMDDSRVQSKIFPKFIRLITDTAEKFDGKNIIVRPHPNVSTDFYQNAFYSYDNIHVDKQGVVRPWIIAADVVIHNSCTTGVTSALLDTPVIAYMPEGMGIRTVPNEVSHKCSTKSEVFEYIANNKGKGKKQIPRKKKQKIKQHVDNIDYLSSEKIADVIDSVAKDTKSQPSLTESKKLLFRQFCIEILGSKRFEDFWVKGIQNEKRHKFRYTFTEEIDSIMKRFSDEIEIESLQMEKIEYMVNGFRIKSK